MLTPRGCILLRFRRRRDRCHHHHHHHHASFFISTLTCASSRQSDPLSWHSVPGVANNTNNGIVANNNLPTPRCCAPEAVYACQDVRITLDVEPRTKLGLGYGIFDQIDLGHYGNTQI